MTDTARPIVVVPGLSELLSPGIFDRVLGAAGPSRTVDLPALLATHGPHASVEDVAGAIVETIRSGDTAVDLVAEGPAASIAARVATEVPTLVHSCVFIAPVGFPQPLTAPLGLGPRLDGVLAALADPDSFAGALVQLCSAPRGAEIAAGLTTRPDVARLDILRHWWASGGPDAVTSEDRQRELRALRQPVQLVCGRDDTVAGLDSGFYLLRRLRSVQLRVVPFCGHLVALEADAALVQILGTFLRVSHEPEHLAPAGTG